MTNLPQARMNDLVVNELDTEILIYDLKINKAYCLNQTSSMIWQLCDGTKTIPEISKSLSGKLNQLVTEDLVWLALDGFKKDNLLEENEKFEINFNGLSRRAVIKRVGLASMIALPMISSLIAPQAVEAASTCTANGQPCTTAFTKDTCCPGSFCGGPPVFSITVCANCFGGGTQYVGANQPACDSQAALCCSGSATFLSNPPIGPRCQCN